MSVVLWSVLSTKCQPVLRACTGIQVKKRDLSPPHWQAVLCFNDCRHSFFLSQSSRFCCLFPQTSVAYLLDYVAVGLLGTCWVSNLGSLASSHCLFGALVPLFFQMNALSECVCNMLAHITQKMNIGLYYSASARLKCMRIKAHSALEIYWPLWSLSLSLSFKILQQFQTWFRQPDFRTVSINKDIL